MRTKRRAKLGRLPYGFLALCVAPALLLATVFMIWPALSALLMSFTNITSISVSSNAKFVFLDNYIYMFTRDRNFLQSLINTLKLIAVVPAITIFIALFAAFTLTQIKLRERGVYRVLFFLPSVVSLTVVGVVWACLFDPRAGGVINRLIALFGFAPVTWLGDERYALCCIALVLIWQAAGYFMVMHIAAIDSISRDIYEAAAIDGANHADKFFCITIPLLKDCIGITYVFSLSGTINVSYILSNVMTNGGPGNSTLVLLQHMYKTAFGSSANFGYAMTITVFSLTLAFLISSLSRRISYQNENIQE
jgi:N-acetylglucosamine transport system permease protein